MAKRKRLTPARQDLLDTGAAPEAKAMHPMGLAPPIAQVSGDAATHAAFQELTDEIRAARENGRLVLSLPLEQVEAGYLVRDRLAHDETELVALMESLRVRGQQTPIEVVELDDGRFGLISGWRRLTALSRLREETGESRFAVVQALLRRPETAADAYQAMVEENEIRVGLSYYERARIVARAVEHGVFPDETAALRGLFATASRAKRSKIGAFLPIYAALDADLRFAAAIPERLGLALSKHLREMPDAAKTLRRCLAEGTPKSAAQELGMLSDALAPIRTSPSSAGPVPVTVGSVRVAANGKSVTLSGAGVTPEFQARLLDWLNNQPL